MAGYNQGIFDPAHPDKYIGTYPIMFRSSWELTMMNLCDQHPNVLQWASESIKIQYQDPETGKMRTYIPDFFMIYIDASGARHGEIVEIKPMAQCFLELAKTKPQRKIVENNIAKWKAAKEWCRHQGLRFRIMTQEQLYKNSSRGK